MQICDSCCYIIELGSPMQWVLGFSAFMFPKASPGTRASMLPWHVSGGRALLYMAICAALTGLMEKSTFLNLKNHREARLINFTGLFVLLFGIFVDLSVALARYVWLFCTLPLWSFTVYFLICDWFVILFFRCVGMNILKFYILIRWKQASDGVAYSALIFSY